MDILVKSRRIASYPKPGSPNPPPPPSTPPPSPPPSTPPPPPPVRRRQHPLRHSHRPLHYHQHPLRYRHRPCDAATVRSAAATLPSSRFVLDTAATLHSTTDTVPLIAGSCDKAQRRDASWQEKTNRVLESTLASILNQSTAKSKGTAHEDNDPLYEPSGDENIEHGVVDKVSKSVLRKSMTINTCMPSGGTGVSKRVMPSCEQDQAARMTRQRTRELCLTEYTTINPQDSAIEDAPVAANSPTHAQSDDQILMSNEGCKASIRGGIVLRQHIPIFTHWKEYKNNKPLVADYTDKVTGQFAIE